MTKKNSAATQQARGALRAAIKAAGGRKSFMDKTGITKQRLHYWLKVGIPPINLPSVAAKTGIPAVNLRPDLLGPA